MHQVRLTPAEAFYSQGMLTRTRKRTQSGLSYVDVLIAAGLLAVCLPAAMSALQSGVASHDAASGSASRHEARRNLLERVGSAPYGSLLAAAAVASSTTNPTSYSTTGAEPIEVFLAPYDGDGDPFVVDDPNFDGDDDVFTGYSGTLWIRVADTEGELVSLIAP